MHIIALRGRVRRIGQRRALSESALKALLELKSGPCTDCGRRFIPEAMDFDHVPGRGGKIKNVSLLKSLRAILAEVEKCDLVCANCHRARTVERRAAAIEAKRRRAAEIQRIGQVEP